MKSRFALVAVAPADVRRNNGKITRQGRCGTSSTSRGKRLPNVCKRFDKI